MKAGPFARTRDRWVPEIAFPLPPALSRGERENRSRRLLESSATRMAECWLPAPPLPAGEGWGEGKAALRLSHLQLLNHAVERIP